MSHMSEQLYEELTGHHFEDLEVGMSAAYAKTITEADIHAFAGVSGDTNPVHLAESYAEDTMFKGRIAHGLISAGLLSAVFGTRLPGPGAVWVRQNLHFKAPVKPGDTVVARVEITELRPEKNRAIFKTECWNGDTLVIDGEAELMVPPRKG